jgi:SAM-dependent methyltransferase
MAYRCNFCRGTEFGRVYNGRDIVQCKRCCLTSVLFLPSESEAQQIYDAEYAAGSFNQFYTNLRTARKSEAALRLRSLAGFARGRELLDVGSGMGYFVEAAIEQGWNACGIEISAKAIELQQGTGLPIFHGS